MHCYIPLQQIYTFTSIYKMPGSMNIHLFAIYKKLPPDVLKNIILQIFLHFLDVGSAQVGFQYRIVIFSVIYLSITKPVQIYKPITSCNITMHLD